MPEIRYVRKCYNYILNTKIKLSVNWALEIKRSLCENNCEYSWLAQSVENDTSFIQRLTEYIRRRHLEAWQTSLNSSTKLSLYRTSKTAYGHEHYLYTFLMCGNIDTLMHILDLYFMSWR